jgi:hypothetical protein
MGFLDLFRKGRRDEDKDRLRSRIDAAYPKGPVRRGTLQVGKEGVIDVIEIYDAGDHWLCLFLGCRALGQSFELSLRSAKKDGDSPPDWCVEPVTRVAGMIADGCHCAPGVTWKLGPFGHGAYEGFVTIADVELGAPEPDRVLQLVPITPAELELGLGRDSLARLCDEVQTAPPR